LPPNIGITTEPAHQGEFFLVSLKGSAYVYSVITKDYYDLLFKHAERAPAELYSDSVYTPFTCPFTFSSLTDNLPFKLTPMGLFRFNVEELPKRDRHFLEFHLECLRILRQYDLGPEKPWFIYAEDAAEYAAHFKTLFKKLQGRISSPS
jgi:hypothetical protein